MQRGSVAVRRGRSDRAPDNAAGLEAAHAQGIVHRDLSRERRFSTDARRRPRSRISVSASDPGPCAHSARPASRGTPLYMSPRAGARTNRRRPLRTSMRRAWFSSSFCFVVPPFDAPTTTELRRGTSTGRRSAAARHCRADLPECTIELCHPPRARESVLKHASRRRASSVLALRQREGRCLPPALSTNGLSCLEKRVTSSRPSSWWSSSQPFSSLPCL